jgi:alpha-galactosidase
MKVASDPVELKVLLHGARQFVIEVDDGGNGRGWDQCTWAEAAVKLENGSVRSLGECPRKHGLTNRCSAPFSFSLGGLASSDLLPHWEYKRESKVEGASVRSVYTYRDPGTGLLLECHATTYRDSAALDWVCYLSNTGTDPTPIIQQFMPLDTTLLQDECDQAVTLRWSNGDSYSAESFMPHDEVLEMEKPRRFTANGGRSSCGVGGGALPFFNCLGQQGGWVVAVGWSGQWAAEFVRAQNGHLVARAGMMQTNFRLNPGERVRTPRMVMLRYCGDEMIQGHNRFRRMMLKHYVQRRDGQPAAPPVCHNTAATVYRSGQEATEANQLAIITKAAELGCEAYWMDAYWYPRPWHTNVGNWFPRQADFPHGLRTLADASHQAGMKFVLWFEPERVYPGTKWDRDHAQFLLRLGEDGNRLLNLGDPEARQFLLEFLDQRIKQWNVDVYRNDFNIQPLPYWNANDEPDRVGVTEMRYVEGLYRLWAELMERNPGLTIDNCASGGRRIDIETCSLSYPLWRSDLNDIGEGLKGPEHWPRMACADQIHVTGLALYIPFQAGPLWDMHPYSVRSAMTSSVVLYERLLHADFPSELAAAAIAELKELRPLFLGDIYPLTPLNSRQNDWHAYQLHRPDLGQGCVMFFRRPDCSESKFTVSLQCIEAGATYRLSLAGETYAMPEAKEVRGRDLVQMSVQIESQPGSALLRYERISP